MPGALSRTFFGGLLGGPPPRRRPDGRTPAAALSVGAAFALLLAAGLANVGCRVDREAFFKRVFTCDVSDVDPGCSKDEDGHAMVCYSGRQLGATDFCARTCDEGDLRAGDVCLPAAKGDTTMQRLALHACQPSQDTTDDPHGACHEPTLACLTTDLRADHDEGLCTTMSPCASNADCLNPVRPVCASSFLKDELYPHAGSQLNLNHLFCLQVGCDKDLTACSPGESCLRRVIGTAANPPDICVPNCDSHHRCPPNFLCYLGVSTSIAPNVCIPGILGFTCSNNVDCLLGDCVDTGIGYHVCATACTTDEECAAFDGPQGTFLCAKGDTPAKGTCQTPDAFRGSICTKDEQCHVRNPEENCFFLDPTSSTGTCLLPCDAQKNCPTRAGIGHVCLPPIGACFPGYQELPCQTDSNCAGDLQCLSLGEVSVCTKGCQEDADCSGDRWLSPSFCHPLAHACVKKLASGTKGCPSDSACQSGHCQVVPSGDGGAPGTVCL